MMAEVVEAVLNKFKADGLDVRQVGFKDLVDGTLNLTRPAVNATVQTASFEMVTQKTYRAACNLNLFVVFQTLRGGTEGDARRKSGTYEIVEAIIQSLVLQDLGLDLQLPLHPVSFRNVTTPEYAKAGIAVYEIVMAFAYNFTWEDKSDDWGMLNSMVTKYYLQPRDYTGMYGQTGPEAENIITTVTGINPITGETGI